jgi:hypothetical protein
VQWLQRQPSDPSWRGHHRQLDREPEDDEDHRHECQRLDRTSRGKNDIGLDHLCSICLRMSDRKPRPPGVTGELSTPFAHLAAGTDGRLDRNSARPTT